MRAGNSWPLSVIAVLIFSVSPATAETVEEQGRVVYHIGQLQMLDVGDTVGHKLGVAEQRGLLTTAKGEVGIWATTVILDLTNGTGSHYSYTITTFEDKSTMITRAEGRTTQQPDGTSTFEGKFIYLGGTGRFADIKGYGSYAGRRMAPLTPGVPVDLYQDYTATYSVPSR